MKRSGALNNQRTEAVVLAIAVALCTLSIAPREAESRPVLQDREAINAVIASNVADVTPNSTAGPTIIEAQPLGGVGGSAASLLLSDDGEGTVEGAMLWTLAGDDLDRERKNIPFIVEIDGRGLLASTTGAVVPIHVYGYLLDAAGNIVAHLAERLVVDSTPLTRAIEERGLKFAGTFSVPAGTYSLRMLVRNQETRRYFLGRCKLDLRSATPTDLIVLPPLVAEVDHRWVYSGSYGTDLQSFSRLIPESATWPSAMPSWKTDRPLDVVIACSEPYERLLLSSQIVDAHGRTLLHLATHLEPSFASRENLFFYRASINAPELPAGRYLLTVAVSDSESRHTTSQSIPVLIHDRREDLVWIDPTAPRPAVPMPEPQPVEQPEPSSPEEIVEAERVEIDIESLPIGETISTLPIEGVGARAAALLMSGQSGGEIGGAVLWTSSGSEPDGNRVSIEYFVELNGRDLCASVENSTLPIEIYGYLVDESGRVVAHLAEGILLENSSVMLAVEYSGLKFVGRLAAPPGLYSLRILIRNRVTQKFFLARRDLDVRLGTGNAVLLLPPLVAEPDDRWVVSGSHGFRLEEIKGRIPGVPGWPAAIPVWKSDQQLEVVVACSELGEKRELSVRLIDRFGRRVLDPVIQVSAIITSHRDLYFYRTTVDAPDLPPGSYRFELSLTDVDTGETASQSLEVLIHDLDDDFVWTFPKAPRAAVPRPLPPPDQELAIGDLEIETMRAEYIDVLRLWSLGEKLEARRQLAVFEKKLESAESAGSLRQLITVERMTSLALAKTNPRALMAVSMLHRDMFNWYRARTEPDLARHSWHMAAMLAGVAPKFVEDQLSVDFGECLLIDLAGSLVKSGQPQSARETLEAAIKITPHSELALLGLGALLERTGFPDLAKDELKRLNDAHPDQVEGKLRLAVNLARVGSESAAEKLFEELQASSQPTWVRVLAYQELARLLTVKERLDEALEVLEQGVLRIPENQRLPIQLAHVHDLAGHPAQAAAIIDRLELRASRQTTSPRYRYSEWPNLDVHRVRSTLAEASDVGLGALREALP